MSERIAERCLRPRGAQNRATFLALRAEVQRALEDGWPVTSVWETLHEEGKVSFSYDAFLRLVNRLIRSGPASATSAAQPAVGTSSQKAPATLPGFTFNSKPQKEDLL